MTEILLKKTPIIFLFSPSNNLEGIKNMCQTLQVFITYSYLLCLSTIIENLVTP